MTIDYAVRWISACASPRHLMLELCGLLLSFRYRCCVELHSSSPVALLAACLQTVVVVYDCFLEAGGLSFSSVSGHQRLRRVCAPFVRSSGHRISGLLMVASVAGSFRESAICFSLLCRCSREVVCRFCAAAKKQVVGEWWNGMVPLPYVPNMNNTQIMTTWELWQTLLYMIYKASPWWEYGYCDF